MGDLPADCNSLRRINDQLDFYKENCEWYFLNKPFAVNARRLYDRKIPIQKKKKMIRIRVSNDIYDIIKEVADKEEEKKVRKFLSCTIEDLFSPLAKKIMP